MTFWQYELANGQFISLASDKKPSPEAVEIPRMPEDGEIWDENLSGFVLNEEIAADMNISATHKNEVHLLKYSEAVMILSGYELAVGLLADEAAALGISAAELAQAVYDKTSEQRAVESDRRAQKARARQK